MKKILLAILVLGATALNSSAQTSKDGGKFSIGIEGALPIGDYSDATNLGIGGSLKYELPVAPKTLISVSAGYTEFLYKKEFKDLLKELGESKSGQGFVPVKAGLKYYVSDGFFAEGQVGAVFFTGTGGGTAFAYAPGIGYTFNGGFEPGVRYEAWSKNGTISQVALRVAYRF